MKKEFLILVLFMAMVGTVSAYSSSTANLQEEDGDLSEYFETGNFQAADGSSQGINPTNGSYMIYAQSSSSVQWAKRSFNTEKPEELVLYLYTESNYNDVVHRLFNGNGDEIFLLNYGSTGTYDGDFNSDYQGSWATVKYVFDWDNNQYDVYINGDQRKSDKSFSNPSNGVSEQWFGESDGSGTDEMAWDSGYATPSNNAPSVDSSNIEPDPPSLGLNVTYNATASDSDGSIDYINLTVTEDGTTVVNDLKRSGSSVSWENVTVPTTSGAWLNATVEAVDNNGATNSTEINRYLEDSATEINIKRPKNQTYFDYDVPLKFTVPDADSDPNELQKCDVLKDGSLDREVNLTDGQTYTDTIRTDKGSSYNLTVSCQDSSGNTNQTSEFYSVQYSNVSDLFGPDVTYETETPDFDLDLKNGDMVNDVTYFLSWNNSVVDKSTNKQTTGINTDSVTLTHPGIPLVNNNNTAYNWSMTYQVNRTDFNGGYVSENYSSKETSQSVYHSYFISQSDTDPADGEYVETDNFKHNVTVAKQTSKASLLGVTKYFRNGETDDMTVLENRSSNTTFQGVLDTGIADSFNQSTFQTSSNITVEFKGDTRYIGSGNDSVNVYRIQLVKSGSSLSPKTKTLNFDTNYEENGYDVNTDLKMDLSLWKDKDQKVRRFSFQSDNKQEHDFYLYPEWAEVSMRTLPYSEKTDFDIIQYEPTYDGGNLRSYFFPTSQLLNNDVTEVELLTINDSETARIDFEITDENGDPAQQTYCRVDRKFPGLGKHKTVFMILTGSEGKSQSFAEVNEIYYRFTCYQDGKVVDTFGDQIMQDPMRLSLGAGDTQTLLDFNEDFDASCTKDNTTHFTCDYQSSSEQLDYAELTIERSEVLQNVEVCSKNNPSLTGSITCPGLNTSSNTYNYELNGIFNDVKVTGEAGVIGTEDKKYGVQGILLTAVLFLMVFAASSFNPVAGIALGTLTLLISSLLDFIIITPTQRASLIAVAIVAGWVMSR